MWSFPVQIENDKTIFKYVDDIYTTLDIDYSRDLLENKKEIYE